MAGNCPKCEKPVAQARMELLTVGDKFAGPSMNAKAAICPECNAILGVLAHPEEIAQAVKAALNKQ